jgi:AraC family transcriptional activator of tynA and feaB
MTVKTAPAPSPVRIEGDAATFAGVLCRTFVELEVVFADAAAPVVAELETRTFGDLELVRTSVEDGVFTVSRTGELLAKSVYNSFFVSCVFAGSASLSQEGRFIELQARDIAVLDSSLEYSVVIDGQVDLLWIRVPRYRLEGRLATPAALMAQRVDGRQGLGRLASSLLHATFDEAVQVPPPQALRVSNSLLDLLALSLNMPEGVGRLRSDTVLRRVQNDIESNLSDPDLSLKRIAERQAVSVRYLNKLFEREGISTARWIRLRRLERCRRDLESLEHRGRSVSEIAYAHGFNEISSFNRAFKTHFGVSPSSLRHRPGD